MLPSRIFTRLLPLFVAACISACSASYDSGSQGGSFAGAAGSAGSGGGSGSDEPAPKSLAFVPESTIALAPKEIQKLTVRTSPAGSFRVRFALLGQSSDAVLDTSEVQTDSDGVGQVTLTAPSKPTTFTLRASVGSTVQARRGVSVSSLGETTLRVRPAYSGRRAIAEWTASVTANSYCGDLGTPPPDGDLVVSAPPPSPLDIDHVPIGVDVAVTLRAGQFVGGCLDVRGLSEGDGNQVLVYASDRPLNFAETTLNVEFGPSDSRPDFDRLLKSAAGTAEAALVGTASSDVSALLDQMSAQLAEASQLDFNDARLKGTWDDQLTSAFGKGGGRRLRDPAARWFSAGLQTFKATDAFAGTLDPQGTEARLQLSRVAGLTASKAGFTSTVPATWSADSSDTLLIGSELSFTASVLVTALAEAPSVLEVPAAAGPAEALATLLDCDRVSQVLVTYGATPGAAAYPRCDDACVADSCRTAVAVLWQRATAASGTNSSRLSLTASGTASVGDVAQATGFRGSWLGELSLSGETAPASGAFSANAP